MMSSMYKHLRVGRVWAVLIGFLLAGAVSAAPLRILPLGDSITWGYGSGIRVTNSYRKTLKSLLDAGGYQTDFVGSASDGDFADREHEGHGGWFTAHAGSSATILGHISRWMAAHKPDVVLLHIGTNDLTNRHEDVGEVALVLDKIYAAHPKVTVVLARIINVQAGGYWEPLMSRRISTFNKKLQAMAEARMAAGDDLIVVDMEKGAGLDYASSDMADSLHPSQQGYNKMGTNWYPSVVRALSRQRNQK